jgi:hypothetical protein
VQEDHRDGEVLLWRAGRRSDAGNHRDAVSRTAGQYFRSIGSYRVMVTGL